MSEMSGMRLWGGLLAAIVMILSTGEGLLLIMRIGPAELRGATRATTAFTLGTALIGTWSLLLHLLPVESSLLLLTLPILLYPAGRLLPAQKSPPDPAGSPTGRNPGTTTTPLMRIALAVTSFQIVFIVHQAITRPVYAWDAWKIWSFRAKVIFLERGFPPHFFESDWAGFAGYPLGIPLVESFLATMIGEWHDMAIKLLFPLFYVAVIVLFVALIRAGRAQRGVAAGLLMFSPAPLLVHHGAVAYMDLPLACFLLAAVTWLVRWEERSNPKFLLLAAMHAGFLVQIKNEGVVFYLLLTAIVMLRARSKRVGITALSRWLLASLPLALPWLLFKYGAGIADSPYHHLAFPGVAIALSRSVQFFRLSAESLFLSGCWGIGWYPLLVLPLFALLRKKVSFGTPALVVTGGFLLFGAAYALTDSYIFLENGTALGRNLLILFPLALAWSLLAIFGKTDQPNE